MAAKRAFDRPTPDPARPVDPEAIDRWVSGQTPASPANPPPSPPSSSDSSSGSDRSTSKPSPDPSARPLGSSPSSPAPASSRSSSSTPGSTGPSDPVARAGSAARAQERAKPAPPVAEEPTKRFTIDLPVGLHGRLKTLANKRGITMARYLRTLLEERLPGEP